MILIILRLLFLHYGLEITMFLRGGMFLFYVNHGLCLCAAKNNFRVCAGFA